MSIFVGLGLAGLGVGKLLKAAYDSDTADEVGRLATNIMKESVELVDQTRTITGETIARYGARKLEILDTSVSNFICEYEKLHNITNRKLVENTSDIQIEPIDITELKQLTAFSQSILSGAIGGLSTGTLIALGTYNIAGIVGTASTGNAIINLSGIAAKNATLSFLGGGSIATGGAGITGGIMVLGGLIAIPTLVIMGFVAGATMDAKLNTAYSNLSEARKHVKEVEIIISSCNEVKMHVWMLERLLIKCQCRLDNSIEELRQIINTSGTDFEKYSFKDQVKVASIFEFVRFLKKIIEVTILDENGGITKESQQILSEADKIY